MRMLRMLKLSLTFKYGVGAKSVVVATLPVLWTTVFFLLLRIIISMVREKLFYYTLVKMLVSDK